MTELERHMLEQRVYAQDQIKKTDLELGEWNAAVLRRGTLNNMLGSLQVKLAQKPIVHDAREYQLLTDEIAAINAVIATLDEQIAYLSP